MAWRGAAAHCALSVARPAPLCSLLACSSLTTTSSQRMHRGHSCACSQRAWEQEAAQQLAAQPCDAQALCGTPHLAGMGLSPELRQAIDKVISSNKVRSWGGFRKGMQGTRWA